MLMLVVIFKTLLRRGNDLISWLKWVSSRLCQDVAASGDHCMSFMNNVTGIISLKREESITTHSQALSLSTHYLVHWIIRIVWLQVSSAIGRSAINSHLCRVGKLQILKQVPSILGSFEIHRSQEPKLPIFSSDPVWESFITHESNWSKPSESYLKTQVHVQEHFYKCWDHVKPTQRHTGCLIDQHLPA